MPITWQVLYEEVYIQLVPEESRLNTGNFMKAVFPKDIFDLLFPFEKYQRAKDPVSAALDASTGSEEIFTRMRNYLLNVQKHLATYTYDTCPAVKAFQKS